MKKLYPPCIALMLLLLCNISNAQLSGTYTIPGTVNGNTVNNLTQLATLLNSSTVSGNTVFEFTSSYAGGETYPIIFTQFTGSANVTIRPAASVATPLTTAGTTPNTALICLQGVKHLTFDGRSGGTGSTVNWQFQKTNNGDSVPVFKLFNGAQYDTLQYLNVQGNGSSVTSTIGILTTTAAAATGNSYNTIQYCNVGPYNNSNYPFNPIYSSGSAAYPNSYNTIAYNNVYNYDIYSTSNPLYGGINISATGNGSGWQIIGNSIYSSLNYLLLHSNPNHGIYFAPGANSTGNVISGNYIGGQAAQCGGGPMQVSSYGANGYGDFDGIYVSSGGATVSNNTIQNIYMASRYGSSTFRGIVVVSGPTTVSNNMIGHPSVRHSIWSGLYGTMIGIQNLTTSTVTISGNTIANFINDGSAYNSMYSSTSNGPIIGIYSGGSAQIGSTNIINNSVHHLLSYTNYSYNQYFPVNMSGYGTSTQYVGGYYLNLVTGICLQNPANNSTLVVSKNTVYSLGDSVSNGSNSLNINGIVCNSGSSSTLTVNANLVYGLYATDNYPNSSSYYVGINGLYFGDNVSNHTNTITNNVVVLGTRPTDGSSVKKAIFTGIWENANSNNLSLKFRFNHNSVYIGGSDASTYNSYAFRREFDYGSTVYDSMSAMNNIFVNNRSNTSTGKNYSMLLNPTLDVFTDYNDCYGTGTNYIYGTVNTTTYASLAQFLLAGSGLETHSISADPQFAAATTFPPDLHPTNTPSVSSIDAAGTVVGTIVYDADSIVRANYSPVDIGAYIDCSSSVPAGVSLAASQTTVCTGTQVTFTATPTNGGTQPNYNFYLNGASVQNGTSNTYTYTPANNDSVKVVITSNAGCVSPATATSSSIILTVTAGTVVPLVTLAAGTNSVCQGMGITFTATPTNGGSAPTYVFYLNNAQVQSGSSNTYSNSNLNNNDSVWVVMTSNAACVSPTTATSAKVYAIILSNVTPTATISPSQNNVCHGTSITFTAGGTNLGTPTYSFYVNGALVQIGPTGTYTTSSLNNNDSVWVVIASTAQCRTTPNATSSKVHMVINSVVPAVTVVASSDTICAGGTVTLTATPTNGGAQPNYAFYLNTGVAQTGTSAGYTYSNLHNNDSLYVIITSNAACANPTTATSNKIKITVSAQVVPLVTISPSVNNVCPNTPITITASGTNTGTSPTYNFYINGTSVQSGSGTSYQISTPHNNDSVWVILTSSSACANPNKDTSSTVHLVVNSAVVPAVSVSSSVNSICAGHSVTYTASPTNGGAAPTYTFYLNGNSVQTGANASYTNANSQAGDSVWVVLTSNAACASPTTATSLKKGIAVNQAASTNLPASICTGGHYSFNGANLTQAGTYYDTLATIHGCDSIIALHLTVVNTIVTQLTDSVCHGGTYTFNGQQLNAIGDYADTLQSSGGCDSVVQLHLIQSQPLRSQYSASFCGDGVYNFNGHILSAGGDYADTLQAAGGCDSIVTLHLSNVAVVTSQIIDSICSGDSYNFNGNTLTAAGTYNDTLTSVGGCDSIVTLNLSVNQLPVPVITNTGVDTLSTTTFAAYQWLRNGVPVNGANSQLYIATQNGVYSVVVTNSSNCSDTSNTINITKLAVDNIENSLMLSIFPNPAKDEVNVYFQKANVAEVNYRLFDINGREMLARNIFVGNSFTINISNFAAGTYLLQLTTGDNTTTRKLELIK